MISVFVVGDVFVNILDVAVAIVVVIDVIVGVLLLVVRAASCSEDVLLLVVGTFSPRLEVLQSVERGIVQADRIRQDAVPVGLARSAVFRL